MKALLFLLLAAHAQELLPAVDPARDGVYRIFLEITRLIQEQTDQDARARAVLRKQIEALRPRIFEWGRQAVPPLNEIAQDLSRPAQVRLWAVTFASLTHDPAAFPTLMPILLDENESIEIRAAAALGISSLEIANPQKRRAFCLAIAQERLPATVLTTVLSGVSQLGCDETKALEARLRRLGPRPKNRDSDQAAALIQALMKSPSQGSLLKLIELLNYYERGSPARAAALTAVDSRAVELKLLRAKAVETLRATLSSEFQNPRMTLPAIRLLAGLKDRHACPLFLRLLPSRDARIIASAAEALAELRCGEAVGALRNILEHVHEDPRFSPRPGQEQPEKLAARIQSSWETLALDE